MSDTEQDTPPGVEQQPPRARAVEDRELAERLVAEASEKGLDLVGPDGVLTDLTKRVLEAGLEAEMSEHLGYDRHAVEGRDGGNSRNGTRAKTVPEAIETA
jgi:putative transposase